MEVVLVTREGCHLCDDALGALKAWASSRSCATSTLDGELYSLYDWRVPVVLVDGHVVAEGRIDQSGASGGLPAL